MLVTPFSRQTLWRYCKAAEGREHTENSTSMNRILTSARSLLRVKILFTEAAFLQASWFGCRILSMRRCLSDEESREEHAKHPANSRRVAGCSVRTRRAWRTASCAGLPAGRGPCRFNGLLGLDRHRRLALPHGHTAEGRLRQRSLECGRPPGRRLVGSRQR